MKLRSLGWLAALALAAACGDVPTTRTPEGPSLAVAPAASVTAVILRTGIVEISWTHDGAGITRWSIYRRPLGTTTWTRAKSTIHPAARRLLDARYSVHVDAWEWMVRGCDAAGCTDSAPVSATGLRLTAPRGVYVAANSESGVTLGWTLGEGPVQFTQIVRSAGEVVLVRAPTAAYRDTEVAPFRRYRYVLRSRNAVGVSADSAEIAVVPGTPNPGAPRVTTDSAAIVAGRMVVWGRVQSGVLPATYGGEWSRSPGMAPPLADRVGGTLPDTTTHVVSISVALQNEGTHYARLWAQSSYGIAYGEVRSAELVRPEPPQDFDASASSDGTVTATWTHDDANVDRWRLLRRPAGTDAWTIARTNSGPGVRMLTDFRYDVDVDDWEWMVQACNGVLCAQSPVELISGLRLFPPTDLRVFSDDPGNAGLSWTEGAGPIVEYVVLRRASVGPVAQWQVPAGTTTFTDTSAQEGVQYHYVVWARNRVGSSPLTGEVGVVPGG